MFQRNTHRNRMPYYKEKFYMGYNPFSDSVRPWRIEARLVAAVNDNRINTILLMAETYPEADIAAAVRYIVSQNNLTALKTFHQVVASRGIGTDPLYAALNEAAIMGYKAIVVYFLQQGMQASHIDNTHTKLMTYIQRQKWLESKAGRLRMLAAKSYVRHHAMLPPAEIIPVDVMKILQAMQDRLPKN